MYYANQINQTSVSCCPKQGCLSLIIQYRDLNEYHWILCKSNVTEITF